MDSPTAVVAPVLSHPQAPNTREETGLSVDLLIQLVLKHLHFAGELTGIDIARRMGVRLPVIEPALDHLRSQYHVEVVGGSMTLGHASFRYRITDAGRQRVAIFLEHNQYVGPAPVPLAQYQRYMAAWEQAAPKGATRDRLRSAFGELVISDRVLDQLGPAINAAHSLFVYGPPGNGKTVISQAIRHLLDGDVAIPHALEIEGQIVRLFDPVNHEELPLPQFDGLLGEDADRRWARCRRPLVMVGGELTMEALELSYNETSGFYHAPVQLIANGGVLVIDDFGRQQVPARTFLNRWIVPLESRVDFLTLKTGQKAEIPFVTLLVFATNIRPSELVDEAFLRRIRYKVFAESPTVDDFTLIFRSYCDKRGIPFDRGLVLHLLEEYFLPRQIPRRGCHPRDLIEQALSLAAYRGDPPVLTRELLDAACASYFVDDREAGRA